jgi:hypothetical protein
MKLLPVSIRRMMTAMAAEHLYDSTLLLVSPTFVSVAHARSGLTRSLYGVVLVPLPGGFGMSDVDGVA